MEKYLEDIRKRFAKDLYATKVTGILIEKAAPKVAVCSLKLTENHMNAAGCVMGGVLFTLADFTFAVASNGLDESTVTVSVSSSIQFMGNASGPYLLSETTLLKDGKNTCFYQVDIYSTDAEISTFITGEKKKVATVQITGFKKYLK
jgi:acyl-CoA thioesterase